MTFIHFTDTHFRTKIPINRTDDILESLFAKFEWCLEYAAEMGAKIIHTGDLFHTPNVPDFVATRVVRLFKKYESEVYFIIGNHDVTGQNVNTYDYSKIGLMAEYKWFHLLAKKPVKFDKCWLVGYDYCKEMECPNIIDPAKDFNLPDTKLPVIACVHSMITDEPPVIIGGKTRTINWNSINTSATLVISGHYHPGWIGVKTNVFGADFINPGALIRQTASHEDMTREPKMCILTPQENKIKVRFKVVPHKKDVFNLAQLIGKKTALQEKNNFIEALESIRDEDVMGNNVVDIIDGLKSKKLPEDISELLTDKVLDCCKKKILELKNG